MLYLGFRMARYRIAALLAVAFATLGGVALVTAVGVLAESGLRSELPAGRLAGADVVVSASQHTRPAGDLAVALPERARIPADLVDRLAGLPGVTAAVGDVSFPAAVVDAGGRVVPAGDPRFAGHGWSATALLDRFTGTAPAGPTEVGLDEATAAAAGVAPGDPITLVAAGGTADYRVSAMVAADEPGIWFHDETARRLAARNSTTVADTAAGPPTAADTATTDSSATRAADGTGSAGGGTVDLIAVRAEPGSGPAVADRVREAVRDTGLVVSTGSARGEVRAPGAAAGRGVLLLIAGSLAGITLLIVGFIVAGALGVSIGAQRREFALLRAVGATPRQVRRLAATQAGIVALAVAAPGVALGYLLTERFRRLLVDAALLPAELPLRIGPLPAIGAVLLLAAVVWVAAWCAAWRTSRRPATEAVAESRAEPRTPSPVRAYAGLLLLLAANSLAVTPLLNRSEIGAAGTAMAGIVAAIGLALAGPALVGRVSRALARRLPASVPAPTWLAVSNTRGYALRVAGAVTTLAMAVVLTLTYGLSQSTLLRATAEDVRAGTVAQFSLAAPGLGGIPDGLLAAVAATPGVRAAAPVNDTTVLWPYRLLGEDEVESGPALVLTPAAVDVLDLGVRAGSLADLAGPTVAVDADTARSRNLSVGDQVHLILGDGTRADARVVASYARGLGFGPVVLSRDLVAGHTSTGLDQRILIRTDGTDATARRLAGLAAASPGLALAATDGEPVAAGPAGVPPELLINVAVLAVLLGYVLLGIANKLVASTTQRGTELAALRLIGATPRQIRAMMRREAALGYALALGTGLLVSAVPLVLLAVAFLGRPWPAGPVWLLPGVAAVVAAIAFLAVELPTRRLLRVPPEHALRAD
ncbi:ABC transporter permease [Solwaraspora sp. WMMD1047]|uniref:FtsX-like permease family protein n=1 Tax=Solwaraspora sp. WMMD1047 TaxID=3016102 RepID=UPI002417C6A1|nr:ABC transporter permease [Solwaraspora sp. WMMD1047]MDG4832790.1 ABC transporter permease [Solwaraspora sp. WMMD1047]